MTSPAWHTGPQLSAQISTQHCVMPAKAASQAAGTATAPWHAHRKARTERQREQTDQCEAGRRKRAYCMRVQAQAAMRMKLQQTAGGVTPARQTRQPWQRCGRSSRRTRCRMTTSSREHLGRHRCPCSAPQGSASSTARCGA